ncbi:hypothetical protein K2173_027166 [Erythroxylum novogranatense]|uniref:Small ribosomal subunit protein uS2c n=1 Tax=Erythroxylum novogranatense TaxID=1862640 RepID=A0AAV8U1J7_9ROSI|nr:hypothetical protein K2173_027166 [Erythroxylum novogranatense]
MIRRYWNINLEEMLEAGVHFGHGTRKWNPRMGPYISVKCKGIHITNLTKTTCFLSEVCDLVFDAARRRKQFLIVARAAIKAHCHFVNKKWLGGILTNWSTIETRLQKQLSHLQTYLGGIKYMTGLPDIVIIVNQQEEYTAL